MTDIRKLAKEALIFEGTDAYHGATVDQLTEFLTGNPDLWEPPTQVSPWETLVGFDRALIAYIAKEQA